MPHKRAKRSAREESRSKLGSDQAPSSIYSSKRAISSEGIPKSVARVLNAANIRQQWKEKKRKLESSEDTGEPHSAKKRSRSEGTKDSKDNGHSATGKSNHSSKDKDHTPRIQPGESLAHFNRRVEDDMRPLVKSAMQSSSAQSRRVRKSELKTQSQSKMAHKPHEVVRSSDRSPSSSPPPSPPLQSQVKHEGRPKEFASGSTSAPRRLNDIVQAPPELKRLPRGAQKRHKDMEKPKGKEGVISMKQKLMMEEEREKAIQRYRALKERRRVDLGGDEADPNR